MLLKFRRSIVGIWLLLICVLATMILCSNDLVIAKHYRRVRRNDVEILCGNSGTWHEKSQRCVCKLGWVGSRCTVWRHHECYFGNGFNYRGRISRTHSGTPCVPWTTSDNSRFELGKNGIGVHNLCRNPDNDEKGLWCYVGGKKFVSYCNITRCPDSYKAILLINATELGPSDSGSAAVKFVFGPLISGVCAGVVALLGFIVIAEYVRRKRYKGRLRRLEKYGSEKRIKKGKKIEEKEKSVDGTGIRTLGGIVTVDVDTGNEKFQTCSAEDLPNTPQAILAISAAEAGSSYLSRDENKQRFRSLSVDTLQKGSPPPYHQHANDAIDENDDAKIDYTHNDVTIQIDDDRMSALENVTNKRKQEYRVRRKRGGEKRNGGRMSIDSCKSVLEEKEDLEIAVDNAMPRTAVHQTDSNQPVPKPRTSIKNKKTCAARKEDNEETNVKETSSRRKSKEKSNKGYVKTTATESNLFENELQEFSDMSKLAGKYQQRKSRTARHNLRRKQRAVSHESYDSRPVKARKNKPVPERVRKLSESDISRKRKSVKEMQKMFEEDETDVNKLSTSQQHDSYGISKVIKEKCNTRQFVTEINDKNEPTTFL